MLPFDPKKPLYGFTMRFPHAERRIHFFLNAEEEHVYFRPQHAPEDWWGVLGDCFLWFDANELSKTKSFANCFTSKSKRFIYKNTFFRQFVLPDPREGEERMWSIHWRPNVGRIYPLQESEAHGHAYFRPRDARPCNLLRAPTPHIVAQFLDEWYDPTSDAREALRFCDLTYDERDRQVLTCETGGLEELEHLIRTACACDPILWKDFSSGSILIDPTEDCPLYVHPIFYNRGRVQSMLPPRLHRVLQRICDCNLAFAQQGKNNRHLSGYPWEPELPPSMLEPPDIYIEVELPTQHERMEALWIMRDWLAKNAPDLMSDWK